MKRLISFIRTTLPIIALVLSTAQINARTISGIVLSSADSTAVIGATCRLVSDSTLVQASVSDNQGAFTLETENNSSLKFEVEMVGYSATEIIIATGDKTIDLGTVYLDDALELDGITVTANSAISSKGRTIIYPSTTDIKSSSSSISLFQKLPLAGLQANPINRTLTVDGTAPYILINGVPASIDDVNALQPKDIAKVEFSRITPARYADKGTSGFLSITLKKRNDGGQVYAWGRSAVNTAFMDGNFKASYHQGPSQFSIFYSPSWRNYQQVFDNKMQSYIGDDFKVNLEAHDRDPFNYHYHQIRTKYDYSPNSSTLLSVTFTAMPSFDKRRTIAHTIDSQLGEYDNYNYSKNKDFAPSLDVFFRRDFDKKNSLEMQVVGTLSNSDYRRANDYTFADGSSESYVMNADSRRRSLISEICYIHNFSDNTQLSAGYQNTVSRSTNEYLNSDYKPRLTENNNYVYARLGQSIGNVYLSLSTGAKMFWTKNDLNNRHFIRNLSSAQISWNINNKWSLQGAFRYTPSIPSLTALTDYQQQTSPYLASNGNPDLDVAENLNYSISLRYSHKLFNATFYSAYYSTNKCVVNDVAYVGNKLFLQQYVNTDYRRAFENSLSLQSSDFHGFGANLYLCLTHYDTAGDEWKHSLTSFDASLSVWWNKGPVTVAYWRKLPGKYLFGQTVGKDENGDALQFEYKPDNHWTLGVNWMYMFDKKGTRYPSQSLSAVNPFTAERYIKNNGNMIVLTVSYSADFGSIFRTARRSLNNSDQGSSLLKL